MAPLTKTKTQSTFTHPNLKGETKWVTGALNQGEDLTEEVTEATSETKLNKGERIVIWRWRLRRVGETAAQSGRAKTQMTVTAAQTATMLKEQKELWVSVGGVGWKEGNRTKERRQGRWECVRLCLCGRPDQGRGKSWQVIKGGRSMKTRQNK